MLLSVKHEVSSPAGWFFCVMAACIQHPCLRLQDIKWTKALKYMLTDLKWCMSWVISRQEGSPGIHELQGSPQDAGPTLSESRSTLPDAAAATQR